MAGSDSEDLDDLLLQAGGASRPEAKRSRDISADVDQDDASQLSEEVSQEYRAPARKAKGPGKKRKTEQADNDELNKDDTFDEDAFVFDGYGKDLIRDSADRAILDTMNELDREYELSQRADARDREMERRRNVRMLQQARAQQGSSQQQQVRNSITTVSLHHHDVMEFLLNTSYAYSPAIAGLQCLVVPGMHA